MRQIEQTFFARARRYAAPAPFDCRKVCRQSLSAQAAPPPFHAARRLKKAAGALLSLLRANDALKPYYAQLVGMVGVADLRAVFERVLPQAGIGGAV